MPTFTPPRHAHLLPLLPLPACLCRFIPPAAFTGLPLRTLPTPTNIYHLNLDHFSQACATRVTRFRTTPPGSPVCYRRPPLAPSTAPRHACHAAHPTNTYSFTVALNVLPTTRVRTHIRFGVRCLRYVLVSDHRRCTPVLPPGSGRLVGLTVLRRPLDVH